MEYSKENLRISFHRGNLDKKEISSAMPEFCKGHLQKKKEIWILQLSFQNEYDKITKTNLTLILTLKVKKIGRLKLEEASRKSIHLRTRKIISKDTYRKSLYITQASIEERFLFATLINHQLATPIQQPPTGTNKTCSEETIVKNARNISVAAEKISGEEKSD